MATILAFKQPLISSLFIANLPGIFVQCHSFDLFLWVKTFAVLTQISVNSFPFTLLHSFPLFHFFHSCHLIHSFHLFYLFQVIHVISLIVIPFIVPTWYLAILFISFLCIANLLGNFVQFHSFDLDTGLPFHVISMHSFIHLFHSLYSCNSCHLFTYFFHFIHLIPVIYSLISFTQPCFSFHIYSLLTFSAFLCNFHRFDLKHGFPFHIISFIHSFIAPERSDSSIVDILMYFTYPVPYAVTRQWNL